MYSTDLMCVSIRSLAVNSDKYTYVIYQQFKVQVSIEHVEVLGMLFSQSQVVHYMYNAVEPDELGVVIAIEGLRKVALC